jgi:hypothetical protein
VAWSTWTFSDQEGEPWRATRFIFQHPDGPQTYTRLLRAAVKDRPGMWQVEGGFSYGPLTSL